MAIYIEKENRRLALEKACTGKELLAKLDINPETVLIIKNGEVVLADEELTETDDVKILSVISGG